MSEMEMTKGETAVVEVMLTIMLIILLVGMWLSQVIALCGYRTAVQEAGYRIVKVQGMGGGYALVPIETLPEGAK